MALLVIAYPKLAETDFAFIQSLRRKEDLLYYYVVDPHFTIVFPVTTVSEEIFRDHVRRISRSLRNFSLVLRCAVLDKDAFNEYTHVFLVPDEGYSNIVRLHDALYTGVLADDLRLDLPFIPHIGVANAIDPRHCKQVADRLNSTRFEIRGTVEELTIVNFDDHRLTPLEKISLI
jgi:hypothetical protein